VVRVLAREHRGAFSKTIRSLPDLRDPANFSQNDVLNIFEDGPLRRSRFEGGLFGREVCNSRKQPSPGFGDCMNQILGSLHVRSGLTVYPDSKELQDQFTQFNLRGPCWV